MRVRVWQALAAVVVVVVAGAGCKDPAAVPRQSTLDRRDLDITVNADGSMVVTEQVHFVGDAGGLVGIPQRHPLEPVRDITVDGQPLAPGQGAPLTFGGTELRIPGSAATITYAVGGGVQAYPDLTVAQLALHGSASDASRQDPLVELHATIHLPPGASGPAGDAVLPHWQNGFSQITRVEGDVLTLDGEVAAWTGSNLAVGFAPGTVLPPTDLVHDQPQRAAFEAQQATFDESTRSLERTLEGQQFAADLTRPIFLGVAVFVVLLMVVSTRRQGRAERKRRAQLDDDVPEELRDPPTDDAPAVVALLLAKGERVGPGAVAGAVLGLAHRRVLSIDGITSEEFALRPAATRPSLSASDSLLLDAIGAALDADGARRGPPLWSSPPRRFWAPYRRAVLKEAKAAGLLARTHKPMLFGLYAVIFATCTWPLWLDQSQVLLVPVLSVASLIFGFPFLAKMTITDAGIRRRSQWLAFRKFLVAESALDQVGAPGVATWGPYLVYAAALDVATTAIDDLAPPDPDGRVRVRADAEV